MPETMFPPEVEQALTYTVTLSEIVSIIVIFDIAALLVLMFLERYDPRVFVTWLVMLILAPPVVPGRHHLQPQEVHAEERHRHPAHDRRGVPE